MRQSIRALRLVGRRIGQENVGDRADRAGQGLQDLAGPDRFVVEGGILPRPGTRRPGTWFEADAERAGRARAFRCIGWKRLTTTVAMAILGHRAGSGGRQFCRGGGRPVASLTIIA